MDRTEEDKIIENAMYMYNQPQVDHIQKLVIDALAVASTGLPLDHARVLVRRIADAVPEKMIIEAQVRMKLKG